MPEHYEFPADILDTRPTITEILYNAGRKTVTLLSCGHRAVLERADTRTGDRVRCAKCEHL